MTKPNALVIGALLMALVAAVVGVQRLLSDRIASERQAASERALLDLLAPGSYDNSPIAAPIPLADSEQLRLPHPAFAYLATLNATPVAVLLPTRGEGYEGSIDLLLAIAPSGQLLALKVLSERETPGLADLSNAARSPWLRGFFGRSGADADLKMKADGGQFDQMAGATVTSRAVSQAVQQGLRYFDAHKAQLLKPMNP